MAIITQPQALETQQINKKSQLLAAVLLGIVTLSVVGFAPLEVIHNAAHDTRHSSGFPCH
jgi:cobalt transporter subunit CbtB